MAEEETTTAVETPAPEPATDEPVQPPVDEPAPEEAGPPDVGESLQQVNQRLDALSQRLPEQETEEPDLLSVFSGQSEEDDQENALGQPVQEGGDEDDAAEIRKLLGEAVGEQMQQFEMRQEAGRREQGIRDLAVQHPRLKEPEVLDEVAARLEELNLQPQDFPADPRHVLMVYRAFEAEAAASAGGPAEADGQKGATLETGAGPGVPEPEVDPAEQDWERALTGGQAQPNAFR